MTRWSCILLTDDTSEAFLERTRCKLTRHVWDYY